jgi:hypothetical protein
MNRKDRAISDPVSLFDPFAEEEIMRERASSSFHPGIPI